MRATCDLHVSDQASLATSLTSCRKPAIESTASIQASCGSKEWFNTVTGSTWWCPGSASFRAKTGSLPATNTHWNWFSLDSLVTRKPSTPSIDMVDSINWAAWSGYNILGPPFGEGKSYAQQLAFSTASNDSVGVSMVALASKTSLEMACCNHAWPPGVQRIFMDFWLVLQVWFEAPAGIH